MSEIQSASISRDVQEARELFNNHQYNECLLKLKQILNISGVHLKINANALKNNALIAAYNRKKQTDPYFTLQMLHKAISTFSSQNISLFFAKYNIALLMLQYGQIESSNRALWDILVSKDISQKIEKQEPYLFYLINYLIIEISILRQQSDTYSFFRNFETKKQQENRIYEDIEKTSFLGILQALIKFKIDILDQRTNSFDEDLSNFNRSLDSQFMNERKQTIEPLQLFLKACIQHTRDSNRAGAEESLKNALQILEGEPLSQFNQSKIQMPLNILQLLQPTILHNLAILSIESNQNELATVWFSMALEESKKFIERFNTFQSIKIANIECDEQITKSVVKSDDQSLPYFQALSYSCWNNLLHHAGVHLLIQGRPSVAFPLLYECLQQNLTDCMLWLRTGESCLRSVIEESLEDDDGLLNENNDGEESQQYLGDNKSFAQYPYQYKTNAVRPTVKFAITCFQNSVVLAQNQVKVLIQEIEQRTRKREDFSQKQNKIQFNLNYHLKQLQQSLASLYPPNQPQPKFANNFQQVKFLQDLQLKYINQSFDQQIQQLQSQNSQDLQHQQNPSSALQIIKQNRDIKLHQIQAQHHEQIQLTQSEQVLQNNVEVHTRALIRLNNSNSHLHAIKYSAQTQMAYAYLESGEYILASIVAEQVIAARDRSSLTQALHSQKDTNGSQLVSIPSSSQQRIASYSPTAHQVQLCKVYLADALSNLAQD